MIAMLLIESAPHVDGSLQSGSGTGTGTGAMVVNMVVGAAVPRELNQSRADTVTTHPIGCESSKPMRRRRGSKWEQPVLFLPGGGRGYENFTQPISSFFFTFKSVDPSRTVPLIGPAYTTRTLQGC